MLPVPPPDPLPRTRDRVASPRATAGPVLPPAAARRVADPGLAPAPAGEPGVAATLTALTDAQAAASARAGSGDPRDASHPSAPARAAAPPSISDAARALAALTDPETQREPVAASVRVETPLLAHAPDAAQAARLALLLARVVERSGLFYEAHQAQWVAGRRTADELRAESGALGTVPGGGDARVAAQLALMDTGVLRLAFDAWPGQPVELEIVDPRARRDGAETPGGPAWQLTLELATPALGPLRVTFALQAGALSVAIAAAEARTRDDVARALPALRRALASHDVALSGIVVADDHA